MKKNTGFIVCFILLATVCFTACYNPIMEKWWEEPYEAFYTVTFETNGGAPAIGDQRILRNEKVGKVQAITRGKNGFGGWYTDPGLTKQWNFATDKVTNDMTLYAKWVVPPSVIYTVTFNLNNGNMGGNFSITLYIGQGAKIPEPTAPRNGAGAYAFTGWYTDDGKLWNFNTDTVNKNLTLTAHWADVYCSVTFSADGGTPEPRPQELINGSKVVEPYAVSRDGFAFGGWYSDSGLTKQWNFAADTVNVTSLILYAKWVTNNYTVKFDANGGSPAPRDQIVPHGTKATMPPAVRKSGSGFGGWYSDQGEWNFNTPVTSNLLLTAMWGDEYFTIVFDSSFEPYSGSSGTPQSSHVNYLPENQVISANAKIIEPPDPERTGYYFAGWCTNKIDTGVNAKWWDFDKPVTDNDPNLEITASGNTLTVTLYAYWVPYDTDMVWVKRGSFIMGDNSVTGAKPAHKVFLDGFYIDKYLVTNAKYNTIMSAAGTHANHFIASGDTAPVDSVTWDMANAYCDKMTASDVFKYRLPTEAEWEYAARGGNGSPGNYIYAGSNNPDDVGWYNTNSGSMTKPVGIKLPNALGIYDMSGNICEWCSDWFDANYYSAVNSPDGVYNPQGPASSPTGERVRRGGCWSNAYNNIRTVVRNSFAPTGPTQNYWTLGFRVVREADPEYYP